MVALLTGVGHMMLAENVRRLRAAGVPEGEAVALAQRTARETAGNRKIGPVIEVETTLQREKYLSQMNLTELREAADEAGVLWVDSETKATLRERIEGARAKALADPL